MVLPPPDQAAVAKCDFLDPNTQSMHFESFPTLCTNPIRCTELCCSDALGSDAVEWLWSTQMAADMTGLLQRMLPILDDTHLAVRTAI